MDLRQLRYFIALNEHRSFVRAADAMGITQPAFSRSIQGLEQEFGCVLVDRGNKDLRPTPEGQVVLQHALSLVQGAALLSSEVTQMTKLDAGEVRFGCGPAPAVKLVPDAVAQFTSAHPRVRTCFAVDNWEKLSRSLNREEIEFFIADIRHFEADPNYQTQALTPKRGVFFCRPGHPLLAKESLSTNDMFDYPLATTLIPPGIRKLLANLSGRIDFSPTIETEHFPALVKIVRQSNAIGVGTAEAFAEDIAQGSLALLHWRNLPQNIDSLNARCGIVSRSGFRLSPAARKMIEVLVSVDQQQVAMAL
ncbi:MULTISPECIES: LysR family transcriptional regulator [Pseudomonas]|uniref:LysR family transcriptional regulator n=1 Tax=Pseudomonas piscis TaxID=2614538 RepID=U6ZUL4_9PSED|nr:MULTISPECIES: LysR family transcriptional regulator [Pseudomonas]AZC15645.1 LysR family transcriptional regulator [Pseudomonas sp. CMR5c]ERO61054.1 transcriptional regulator [Pseudomonas piscis]MCU7648472.1 LysR family transcriptional regulator [Pseudomonas piscis]MQA56067.1 LysR family transcriptional regulator [Pseudomonas piscis]POA56460.1 LysR family transcriptional regulator [Pseudomonas sp. FW507-12TSA]